MKISLIFLFGLFLSVTGFSQPCLPTNFIFSTQAQIDNFHTNYPNCAHIEGNVLISGSNITNLNGLNVLASVGGHFYICDNPILTSLAGLGNLNSIGEDLWIYSNNILTSLTGLDKLTSIGGTLDLDYNTYLISLSGLDNINSSSITNLEIQDNKSLTTCEVKSICYYLASPNGTIAIERNALGCNSQEEVEMACAVISVDNINDYNAFSIYPNPSNGQITIETTELPVKSYYSIMNLNGQELLSTQIIESKTELDITDLPRGVYFVRVTGEKSVAVRKFIKQ